MLFMPGVTMENLVIRKARLEDKEQVNQAHVRSIKEVCSRDYSPEQIEKWSSLKYSDDIWSNTVNKDCCYLIEKDSQIYGFCHAKIHNDNRGEIAGLYFTPEILGKGFGRKIFERCLAYLKQFNPEKIFIVGTKTAKGFYETMGFRTLEKKIIQIRGVDVECYHMEREI